ncbi:MAG: hypothetical protein ABR613_06225 [Actinomycetota bacterium]
MTPAVRNRAAAAVAIWCLFLGLPEAAARHARGAIPKAAGQTTVTAGRLAYTRVEVPEAAGLALQYSKRDHAAPRFVGGDGFAAVVLVSEDRLDSTFLAARLPRTRSAPRRYVSIGEDLCQLEKACRVPAGTYRLYVVTQEPVRVEIELQGLTGATTIAATTAATGELSGATESYFHSTPGGPVEVAAHGAGFSPEPTGRANLIFSTFWFAGSDHVITPAPANKPLLQVGDAGICRFRGSPPPEAYAPGCPTGDMRGNFSTFRAVSDFAFQHWGAAIGIGPGQYGWGNFAVHTGIRDPGFVGFWLDVTR